MHPQLAKRALWRLMILDAAGTLEDLKRPPGNRLRPYMGTERDNIVSASTINIESVSGGHLMDQKMLKSQIIIEESR